MSSSLVSNLVNKNKKTFKPNLSAAKGKKRQRDSRSVDVTGPSTKKQASGDESTLPGSSSNAVVANQQQNDSQAAAQPTQPDVSVAKSKKLQGDSQCVNTPETSTRSHPLNNETTLSSSFSNGVVINQTRDDSQVVSQPITKPNVSGAEIKKSQHASQTVDTPALPPKRQASGIKSPSTLPSSSSNAVATNQPRIESPAPHQSTYDGNTPSIKNDKVKQKNKGCATAITTPSSSAPTVHYSALTQQPTRPINTAKRAEYNPNKPPPEPWLWPASKSSNFKHQDLEHLTKEYYTKKFGEVPANADPSITAAILSDEEGLKAYIAEEYNKSHTIPQYQRSFYDEVEGFRWVEDFNKQQQKKQQQQAQQQNQGQQQQQQKQQQQKQQTTTKKKTAPFPPSRWGEEETEQFYNWLKTCGTDFNMMARVIHGKTEKDIRSKFNYEEKKNKKKVEEHLEVDDLPDVTKWERVAGMSYEDYQNSI